MKVLYSEIYEREGNDAWLIDKIQIIKEDGELSIRHKINHKGWGGNIKSTFDIDLEEYDTIEEKQEKIRSYMEDQCLTPEMTIPNLNEILEEYSF